MFVKIHKAITKIPIYGLSLRKCKNYDFDKILTDPWPASGQTMSEGCYNVGGEVFNLTELLYQLKQPRNEHLLVSLHSFNILRDLRAIGDNLSRKLARQLITYWIENNHSYAKKSWSGQSWQPDVMGYRLANWLGIYEFFGKSADDEFRKIFASSVFKQLSYLSRAYHWSKNTITTLYSLKGLIYGACSSPNLSKKLAKFINDYERILKKALKALFEDDCLFNRHIATCLLILRDLIEIRLLLRHLNYPNLNFLNEAIQKIAPIIRLSRHSDGTLANFYGNSNYRERCFTDNILNESLIDMVLSLSDVGSRPHEHAIGYVRCATKAGTILVNCKPSSDYEFYDDFCGPATRMLDFEFSLSRYRFVQSGDLVIQAEDNHWVQVDPNAKISYEHFDHKVKDGHDLIDIAYNANCTNIPNIISNSVSLYHNRQIYLSPDGNLRGLDKIKLSKNTMGAVRFIMGKNTEIIPNPNQKNSAILLLNSKVLEKRDNQRWRFLWDGADDMVVQTWKGKQALLLTFYGNANACLSVKWSFYHEK